MNKPNILLIFADQMRFDAMGMMGNPIIHTPNLDRLAAGGVLFKNAITPAPLCTPARSCTILGHNASYIGAYGNSEPIHYPAGEALPHLLKEQGYFTQAIGKMHFGGPPYEVSHGFDDMILSEEMRGLRMAQSADEVVFDHYDRYLMDNKRWGWEKPTEIGYNEIKPTISPLEKKYHVTQWCGDETVKWLNDERPKDSPFFLWTSFVKPHVPYDCPRHLIGMYDEDKMPDAHISQLDGTHKNPLFADYIDEQEYNLYSKKAAKRALAHYYANITFIDEQVGRILGALDQQNIAENTLVIFTADHGDMMGDHGLWYKSFGYEGSVHIPMIARWPGVLPEGEICGGTTSLVDLYPTILAAAGGDDINAEKRPGISLLDVSAAKERDLCISEMFRGKKYVMHARTKKWKLLFHANGGFLELYDLENDPYEMIDLAEKQEYSGIIADLKKQCEKYLMKYGDASQLLDEGGALKEYEYEPNKKGFAPRPFSRMPWDYRLPPAELSDDEKGWFWRDVDGDWATIFRKMTQK
ncbi:MAG: sulfatase [Christensenellales bacterium]|jgi:arylsulfatase